MTSPGTRRKGTVPWPEEAVRRYVRAGHWRGRPLGDYVWDWAAAHGDRVAVVDGETRWTYRALAERVDALADRLLGLGLADGDNVLAQLPNTAESVVFFLACLRIGVAPVLALPAHREHELGYLADLAEVKAIATPDRLGDFAHQVLAAELAKARKRIVLVLGDEVHKGHHGVRGLMAVDGDAAARRHRLDRLGVGSREVALFLLSGGTTGVPKIIPRTHDDYEYNARRSGEVCGFGPDTVFLVTLPVAHNFPLGSPGLLATLMVGGRVVLTRSPRPEVAFAIIERQRVTTCPLVPAIGQRWAEAARTTGHDLSSLRTVQIGGSVLPAGFATTLADALGCRVQQVYGMAEGLLNYTRLDDPPQVAATTQGRPISADDECRVVDDEGRDVPAGAAGELLTRGPYTPRGYFRAPEHNLRAFTPDGWYRTGDIVRVGAGGNFVVLSRIKDLVNRGGEKVSAPEVEDLALELPAVRQAAVIPIPDPELGERVGLCVVLHADQELTLEQLRLAFEARGVAKYKIPERLDVLAELPLTAVGKVDKKQLRRQVVDGAAPVRA
ncbi:(2,3-dihydroxybenzoyl)adenylate synthase [Actinokineospora enzanensis]|uniref:(2,3-dihydroxybenzoyl)adenylate synthase n=1 Tax=Actinokineospora enzanensis TaxID=155975 RepID=UPI0003671F94|nr:AMP-binding protein [Actinokineospora enzanensis]